MTTITTITTCNMNDSNSEIRVALPTTPRKKYIEPVCPDAPRKSRRRDISSTKNNLFSDNL